MRSSVIAAAAGLLVSVTSHAEPTRNIELTAFDPTPTTQGSSFHVQSAEVGRSGELVISTWLSYASNPLVLETVQNPDPVVQHRTMLSLAGAYAFGGRFEAGARMPFYVQSGMPVQPPMPGQTPMFATTPADGAVLGDLVLHGKVQLWKTARVRLAAAAKVKFPTATDDEFAGTEMPSLRTVALLSFAASPRFTLHVNGGGVLRKTATFANIEQGNGMTWGAGLVFRVAHALFVDAEMFGDIVPNGRIDDAGQRSMVRTFEGLVGARYQVSRQVGIGLAVGRGLTADFGTPELRGVLTLAFTPSAQPLPPLPAGSSEQVDLAQQDSDFDKISDAVDACPHEPEDKDGFQDDDGCPELDNDADGVPDEHDKCPLEPEDRDGFEDDDGCPELDNDGDGIPDAQDACPLEPEKINGNQDDDGCPDKGESLVISAPERLELLEAVVFSGSAVSRRSANVLGQLAATLRARADIVRLRITVHVQPTKNRKRDQTLSEQRATAIRDWLVARGIAEERIEARGFGGTKPLVSPTKRGAAAINNRVELIILERR